MESSLADWRRAQRLSYAALGARLGVSGVTARRLCRGERLPDRALMARIAVLTGGAVRPGSFFPEAMQAIAELREAA